MSKIPPIGSAVQNIPPIGSAVQSYSRTVDHTKFDVENEDQGQWRFDWFSVNRNRTAKLKLDLKKVKRVNDLTKIW